MLGGKTRIPFKVGSLKVIKIKKRSAGELATFQDSHTPAHLVGKRSKND